MELVSFVFQEVFLFNDTIMENIRVGRKEATDDEVVDAAKRAMCHDFIMRAENQYHTPIGDSGCKLSGGERQRISIARAILRNTPIIVLDEATAYADPENEDKIQESINNLTQDKTLITIAHRLSTIIHSDKILVVDNGRLVGEGTHPGLLQQSTLYKNMWDAHIMSMDWQFDISGKGEPCLTS
jgi:ABC-type multidrug transport system fused ATPase/permease subunit